MIRVLHAISGFDPRYGGPSVALAAMIARTGDLGIEATVVTTGALSDEAAGWGGDEGTPGRSPQVLRFPEASPRGWRFSPDLARWLRRHVASFDLVHIHGLWLFPTTWAAMAARRHRVPYVVRPAGMLDAWSLRQSRRRKQAYLRLFELANLRGAAAIHVTSQMERRSVEALSLGNEIAVIPHGVAPAEATGAPDPWRGRSGVRLLFLSRVHPKKRLEDVLEAGGMLSNSGVDWSLSIVGTGDGDYLDSLRALVSRLGIEANVLFAGFATGARKAAWLKGADFFVLPSQQENFGLAVAEALVEGVPVIISREVALAPEVEAAGAGAVVPVRAPARIAAAVARLSSPPARDRAGAAAAELAATVFSPSRQAQSLSDLYTRIASRRG